MRNLKDRRQTIRLLALLALTASLMVAAPASAQSLKTRSSSVSFAASLQDLDMVSPNVGWALSYWDPPVLGVVRTINGGRTWRFVGPASARLVFECANYPWGAGFALFALNSQTAWLAGHCDGAGGGTSRRVNIWRTNTAGTQWTKATIVNSAFYMAHAVGLGFSNSQSGWVGPESLDGFPVLYSLFRTEDGGARWAQVTMIQNILGFTTNKIGYGYDASPTFNTGGADYSDFNNFPYLTTDGGKSWIHGQVAVPPGFRSAWLWIGTLTSGLHLPTGTAGFSGSDSVAVPLSGAVGLFAHPTRTFCATYHTNDGGTRWWYVMSKQVCPAEYLTASVGWGVSRDGSQNSLYRTTDGGYHWTLMGHSEDYDVAGRFTFVTPNFGYILGLHGGIEVTHDGGSTWNSINPEFEK